MKNVYRVVQFFWSSILVSGGILALTLSHAHASTQTQKSLKALKPYFDEAANEFFVPEKLIEGIAFTESRWVQRIPTDFDGTEAEERPKAFGVMGLRSDEWFGHSLDSAAKLIHEPRQNLILEARANIRGATALLAVLAREQVANGAVIEIDASTPGQKKLVSWATVIALYSGIHSPSSSSQNPVSPLSSDEAQLYVRDVLKAAGDASYVLFKDVTSDGPSLDYSGAVWSPSPNFTSSADSSKYIVIHVTDGSFAGALSWLKNPESKASAHYLVRSSDGQIVQLVAENDIAWHVRCWNPYAIGIEHEGFTSTGEDLTEQMYESSAKLVANIAARKGIPVDSDHIIGHNYWQTPAFKNQTTLADCNDHVDPGNYWNWDHYYSLIRSELGSQTNHGAY